MNVRGLFLSVFVYGAAVIGVRADVLTDAQSALDVARIACSGLSDEISRVSGMAVAGVATNAVGAVAGAAAVGVGVEKAADDKQQWEKTVNVSCDFQSVYEYDLNQGMELVGQMGDLYSERSKRLGNWRTGLMAGAGVTHIASAVLGGINLNQTDLEQHVMACNNAVNQLQILRKQMADEGISPFANPIRGHVEIIIDRCAGINVADVEKIERREKVVLGTSATGAAAAIAGAVTSASANSDKMRQAVDEAGKNKYNQLNTASNALAGVSGVGSVVSTVFNASLVKLTRQMIKRAQECEGALQQ